jgi:hypothetical protein
MRSKPLKVIEHAVIWPRLVAVVNWFLIHPRPGLYSRQIDAPGVDTKFIEQWFQILSSLLDAVLSTEAIDLSYQPRFFAERYGLRTRSLRVPIRILDPLLAIGGLTELIAPLDQLTLARIDARHMMLVENEITALSFPPMAGGLLIHGMGKAIEKVAVLPWLRNREVWYWGDIDTHGFAILSRLRAVLPQVRSILMDEATLFAHKDQWVIEPVQDFGDVLHLSAPELALRQSLRTDAFDRRVRLEQERVSWGWA